MTVDRLQARSRVPRVSSVALAWLALASGCDPATFDRIHKRDAGNDANIADASDAMSDAGDRASMSDSLRANDASQAPPPHTGNAGAGGQGGHASLEPKRSPERGAAGAAGSQPEPGAAPVAGSTESAAAGRAAGSGGTDGTAGSPAGDMPASGAGSSMAGSGTQGPTLDACGQEVPADPSRVHILSASVMELPALAQHPAVMPRGPGLTARFGDRVLWAFGRTLSNTSMPGVLGTSTSSFSTLDNPLNLDETQPGAAMPQPLVPDLPEDRAALEGSENLVYDLGSLIPTGDDQGLLFYTVNASTLLARLLGTRVARVYLDPAGGHSLLRVEPALDFVFDATKLTFRDGLLGVDGYVYLYACSQHDDSHFDCRVARAQRDLATLSSAYTFWTGGQWSADASAAAPVISEASGRISVSYNPYLSRYLAVHFVWILNEIRLEIAERPEGPWLRLGDVTVTPNPVTDALAFQLDAIEHPELATQCGKRLLLSYLGPTLSVAADGSKLFQLRPVALEFE